MTIILGNAHLLSFFLPERIESFRFSTRLFAYTNFA